WVHDNDWSLTSPEIRLRQAVIESAKREDIKVRLDYRYLGARTRNDREEGVVVFAGTVSKRDGGGGGPSRGGRGGGGGASEDEDPIGGFFRGAALVDLATGYVTLAKMESEYAVQLTAKVKFPNNPQAPQDREVKVQYFGSSQITLHRQFSPAEKMVKPEVLL